MNPVVVKETNLSPPLVLVGRGKVRDIYRVEDKLLIVSTDRLSAFDVILPDPIPDKGKVSQQAQPVPDGQNTGCSPQSSDHRGRG